ncbi:PilT/PilU family type 4a pilus ATPase [Candidatus Marithioploca araucensis]|uniref:PilT/PilU family type 4a pilus ATPase n=1 Tax=Candidatus Marithioploca araucensis TaxID=70273 RepID=A0ABT7VQX6_9GAMM|nr:PilT/PilU family type 4a pilus ATPase [Candidatus Marithioploca araucensis]
MDLSPYLKLLTEKKGSDLFVSVGSPITIKLSGKNKPVGKKAVTAEMAKAAAFAMMSDAEKKQFIKDKALEFIYKHALGEFKVSLSFNKKGVGIVIQPASASEDSEKKADSENKKAKAEPKNDGPPEIPLIDSTDLLDYLRLIIEHSGSDLFVTVGSQIKAKIYGAARPLSTFVATPEITKKCAFSILTDEQIAQFEETRDLDFAISMPDGSARFRGNGFFQRKTIGLVMRFIPSEIPKASDLGLPDILLELIMAKRGLLLMVGGTGSGKSTTLAAMIDHRNANSPGHILTIEDPVEFSHPNQMSIVNQREVGVDTMSYAAGIKASLREAPDVILIGEIRTTETMEAALELANTGHLCISTMHANNANQALDRIVNMFPTDKHKALFMDMSSNISAIVSQRLIPDVRGKRCAGIEIMINTPNIANLILKGKLNEIKDAMKGSGAKGMQTFDDALFNLYKAGKVSLEEALNNADSRNDLQGKIQFG